LGFFWHERSIEAGSG